MYGDPLLSHSYSFCALVCVRARVRSGSLLIWPAREGEYAFPLCQADRETADFLIGGDFARDTRSLAANMSIIGVGG